MWRDASAQLQEEAAGAYCSSIPQVMEEGDGLAAVAQLQPRPVFVQMMMQVLQLAHAAAAAGTAPFSRSPPTLQSENAVFSAVIPSPGVAFEHVIAPLTQDGVRPVELFTFLYHILQHQSSF